MSRERTHNERELWAEKKTSDLQSKGYHPHIAQALARLDFSEKNYRENFRPGKILKRRRHDLYNLGVTMRDCWRLTPDQQLNRTKHLVRNRLNITAFPDTFKVYLGSKLLEAIEVEDVDNGWRR